MCVAQRGKSHFPLIIFAVFYDISRPEEKRLTTGEYLPCRCGFLAPRVGDNCNYNASGVVLYVGGNYNQNRNHGLFHVNGNNAASNKNANIGSLILVKEV